MSGPSASAAPDTYQGPTPEVRRGTRTRPRGRDGRFITAATRNEMEELETEIGTLEDDDPEAAGPKLALAHIKEQIAQAEIAMENYESKIADLQKEVDLSKWIENSEVLQRAKKQKLLDQEREQIRKELADISLTKTEELLGGEDDLDIKVTPPDDFDGSPEKLKGFLTQCKLIFAMRPKKFQSGKARLLYCLSCCSKGIALTWKEKVLANQGKLMKEIGDTARVKRCSIWEAIKIQFQNRFLNLTAMTESQHKLMNMKQGNRKTEDYITEFELTAMDAGLEDAALMLMFKRGLKPVIKQRIYDSGNIPQTIADWALRATAIDIGWRESQLERGSQNNTFSKARFAQGNNNTGKPKLSDEEFQRRRKEKACFSCGNKGHFAKDCRVKGRRTQTQEIQEEVVATIETKPENESQDFI